MGRWQERHDRARRRALARCRGAVVVLVLVAAWWGSGNTSAGAVGANPVIIATTTADVVDPDDGVLSLREAVILADSLPGDDVISLSTAASYELSCPVERADEDAGLFGDLDHHGGDLLRVTGRGSTLKYAAGCEGHRLLHANRVELRNLVVTGGRADGPGGALLATTEGIVRDTLFVDNHSLDASGGAVSSQGSVTVRRSTFVGNRAGGAGGAIATQALQFTDSVASGNRAVYDGGALSVGAGQSRVVRSVLADNITEQGRGGAVFGWPVDQLSLVDAQVERNVAERHSAGGGGLYVDGVLVLRRTSLIENEAHGVELEPGLWGGGSGGAIYARGEVTVRESVVADNTAGASGHGGGIYTLGRLAILDSELDGNEAGGWGGAVASADPGEGSGSLDLRRSLVASNRAGGGGGGIWVHQPQPIVISDTTIVANEAVESWGTGAGIHARGQLLIVRSEVRANIAGSFGAGLYFDHDTNAVMRNTAVTENFGNDLPGIAGPGGGTTFVSVDTDLVHGNLGAHSAEIGGVVLG